MKTTTTKIFTIVIFNVFMSIPNFSQWTPVSNGLPVLSITGVANVRDTLFTAVQNHGIYYSINNGDNWTTWKHNSKLASTNITKIEGLFTFANSNGGGFLNIFGNNIFDMYLSQGGGSIYLNFNSPNELINGWTNEQENGNDFDFLGTNNGVYYSTDKKQTWIKSTGLSGEALIVNGLYFHEYEDDTQALFALTNDGVYKSNDMGVSFTAFRNGINADVKTYQQHILVATSNGMFTYDDDTDTYKVFIQQGDFRTSLLDYSNFLAFAFGNGVAKKISLSTGSIEDISQENITRRSYK